MKKIIALLLVLVLAVSFTACASEEAALYEKYAQIIDALEQKDYTGAIQEITHMAIAEQQGNVEKVPLMQLLCGKWYTMHTGEKQIPEELSFSEDGTCSIGGQTMNWLTTHEDSTHLRVEILQDGQQKYFLTLNSSESYAVPYVYLSYAEVRDGEIREGDTVANYYNHPMISLLRRGWSAIDSRNPITSSFHIDIQSISFGDQTYTWSVTDGSTQDSLTISLEAKNGGEGAYTMTLQMRGEYPALTVADAEGNEYLFYNSTFGYDPQWVEYCYVKATRYLESYLENGSFWDEDTQESYNDNNAVDQLYALFTQLEGFGDSAQILEDWDAVLYSRAMRYLNRYLENGYFYANDVGYSDSKALGFVYGLLAEIADYGDVPQLLARFTILPEMYTGSTRVTVDNMGNESTRDHTEFTYDENGNMLFGRDPSFAEIYGENELYFTYDESGKITEVRYGNVMALMTPGYDENGNMVSLTAKYNAGTYTYTYEYDDAGRVIVCRFDRNVNGETDPTKIDTYTFTYEGGKLVEKVMENPWSSVHTDIYTTTYTYDANGVLVREELVVTRNYLGDILPQYTQTIEYTVDEQGRPATASYTTDQPGENYQSRLVTYHYEDLYFFDATGLEPAE